MAGLFPRAIVAPMQPGRRPTERTRFLMPTLETLRVASARRESAVRSGEVVTA